MTYLRIQPIVMLSICAGHGSLRILSWNIPQSEYKTSYQNARLVLISIKKINSDMISKFLDIQQNLQLSISNGPTISLGNSYIQTKNQNQISLLTNGQIQYFDNKRSGLQLKLGDLVSWFRTRMKESSAKRFCWSNHPENQPLMFNTG